MNAWSNMVTKNVSCKFAWIKLYEICLGFFFQIWYNELKFLFDGNLVFFAIFAVK